MALVQGLQAHVFPVLRATFGDQHSPPPGARLRISPAGRTGGAPPAPVPRSQDRVLQAAQRQHVDQDSEPASPCHDACRRVRRGGTQPLSKRGKADRQGEATAIRAGGARLCLDESTRPGSNRRPSRWQENPNPRKISHLRLSDRHIAARSGISRYRGRQTAPRRLWIPSDSRSFGLHRGEGRGTAPDGTRPSPCSAAFRNQ